MPKLCPMKFNSTTLDVQGQVRGCSCEEEGCMWFILDKRGEGTCALPEATKNLDILLRLMAE